MGKEKKKGLSLLTTLLLMGAVPLLISAIIMTIIAVVCVKTSVQKQTYAKLKIGAESVNQYFAYDIIANGAVDYEEYADHEFMEGVQSEEVELTLFKGDTRFLTSLKNSDGSYNEGTQANADIYAKVSKGEDYTSDDVVINGTDYYVYYEPVYDGQGAFWGMAFAGTPQITVKEAINDAIIKLFVGALIVAIVFCTIILLVTIRIKRSIVEVGETLVSLSEGDISVRIERTGFVREIAEMIGATNLLQEKLSDVIGLVKKRTDNLKQSIDEVQMAAGESSHGTSQVANSMEELSNSTIALTENVQDVNSRTISMGEHIQGITENVEMLSSASSDIKEATERAQGLMAEVLESSDQSALAASEIGDSIVQTNASIEKITEAVDFITSIASQTNLLSLNASIEAARAGESGKGFAVVAGEIGKLAADSANTAGIIRELANDMNSKSSKTVELAGKIGNIISDEKNIVASTQQAFAELGAAIEESLAMISEIDSKAAELSVLKDGIIDNLSDLSGISEQNAASNQEVSASISDISGRVNHVSEQSDSMKEMSEQLQVAIAYFN